MHVPGALAGKDALGPTTAAVGATVDFSSVLGAVYVVGRCLIYRDGHHAPGNRFSEIQPVPGFAYVATSEQGSFLDCVRRSGSAASSGSQVNGIGGVGCNL